MNTQVCLIAFGAGITLMILAFCIWLSVRSAKNQRIYLICPVRRITEEQQWRIEQYVAQLEAQGYSVHFPPRDVDQSDPIGFDICSAHRRAIKRCGRVDIFWDVNSSGSHFDLGMAWALGKKIRLVELFQPDNAGKSYAKVIELWANGYR